MGAAKLLVRAEWTVRSSRLPLAARCAQVVLCLSCEKQHRARFQRLDTKRGNLRMAIERWQRRWATRIETNGAGQRVAAVRQETRCGAWRRGVRGCPAVLRPLNHPTPSSLRQTAAIPCSYRCSACLLIPLRTTHGTSPKCHRLLSWTQSRYVPKQYGRGVTVPLHSVARVLAGLLVPREHRTQTEPPLDPVDQPRLLRGMSISSPAPI